MKVKALLSVLAAGAIVTTAGVSYAAWDKTSDEASTTINMATATTVSIDATNLNWSGSLAPAGSSGR